MMWLNPWQSKHRGFGMTLIPNNCVSSSLMAATLYPTMDGGNFIYNHSSS